MIFYFKPIFSVLFIGGLFIIATTSDEIELMNNWELNFHHFINNYASNIQPVRPFIKSKDRIASVSSVRVDEYSFKSTTQIPTSSKPIPSRIDMKNATNERMNDTNKMINSVKLKLTTRTTDQVTTNRPINVTKYGVLKNQTNITSTITSKSTTKLSPIPSIQSDLNQVIYTPVECGRSFDEDWLHEGELNKLYASRQSSSPIGEQNKRAKFGGKQLFNTGNATYVTLDTNTEKASEDSDIESNLKHLVDEVNYPKNESSLLEIKNYSENVNLNVEHLIKNFNISSSNETDLQMLKSVLANREEYHYYGEKRIMNGQRANPGQFPWIASIQALVRYPYRNSPPRWRHICGASIINSHWLLTAFIFLRSNNPTLSVVVGSLSWNNSEAVGQRYMVKDWRKYFEPFDALGQYLVLLYDIALIRLKTPIQFSSGVNGVGAVERVCLPKMNDHHVNEELRVSGWGSITQIPKITVPKYLNYVDLPFVPDAECDKRYWPIRNSNRFICAGYLDDSRLYGICMGDSGSPLVSKDLNGRSVQVGVASGGRDKCGSGRFPATYAKVSVYRDWIKTITGT